MSNCIIRRHRRLPEFTSRVKPLSFRPYLQRFWGNVQGVIRWLDDAKRTLHWNGRFARLPNRPVPMRWRYGVLRTAALGAHFPCCESRVDPALMKCLVSRQFHKGGEFQTVEMEASEADYWPADAARRKIQSPEWTRCGCSSRVNGRSIDVAYSISTVARQRFAGFHSFSSQCQTARESSITPTLS